MVMISDGVAADQLWFERLGDDLRVSIIGHSDSLTVSGWYLGAANHVGGFQTSGAALSDGQVDNLVSAMAMFAPPPIGETALGQDHADLLPVIAANWQPR